MKKATYLNKKYSRLTSLSTHFIYICLKTVFIIPFFFTLPYIYIYILYSILCITYTIGKKRKMLWQFTVPRIAINRNFIILLLCLFPNILHTLHSEPGAPLIVIINLFTNLLLVFVSLRLDFFLLFGTQYLIFSWQCLCLYPRHTSPTRILPALESDMPFKQAAARYEQET